MMQLLRSDSFRDGIADLRVYASFEARINGYTGLIERRALLSSGPD
jgi:hypothetical protein